ncbi:hypothetical protein QVD17_12114 [Tagetes erecta]|uniref:Uncharacterized protein n=1 Tax=Tagetes erecta TaxID=13708 RepID=A0AAD8KZ75_TARER|nr:hypothetical protein QVD17_12114 [Tagetes erecta]
MFYCCYYQYPPPPSRTITNTITTAISPAPQDGAIEDKCMYMWEYEDVYVGALRELLEQLAAERTPEGLPRSDFFAYAPDCFAAN